MTAEHVFPKFEAYYDKMKAKDPVKYKLGRILVMHFKKWYFLSYTFILIASLCDVTIPLFIMKIIAWLNDPNANTERGIMWASLISISYISKTIITRNGSGYLAINQYMTGVAIRGILFKNLSSLGREGISYLNIGNLTNIMNHDTAKFQLMMRTIQRSIQLPIMVAAGVAYLIVYFGWMALLFPVFLCLWLAVMLLSNYFLHDWQRMVIGQSDKRAKLITECLTGIKNIKFECWEDIAQQRLAKFRASESSYLFRYFVLICNLSGFNELFTPIFMLAFLSIYTRLHGDITIDKAYLLIAISNMISTPMKAMLTLVDTLSSVKISLERLNEMLEIPTFKVNIVDGSLGTGEIVVDRVTAGWTSNEMRDYFKSSNDPDVICLKDISYHFVPGKMYAVIGKIGSGKSAFLAAVLGQLSFRKGAVRMHGSIGLVAQQPFLMNATVQDNILFGLQMDRKRYIEVLVKCRLTGHILVLSGGDQTEIGREESTSVGVRNRESLWLGLCMLTKISTL